MIRVAIAEHHRVDRVHGSLRELADSSQHEGVAVGVDLPALHQESTRRARVEGVELGSERLAEATVHRVPAVLEPEREVALEEILVDRAGDVVGGDVVGGGVARGSAVGAVAGRS